MLFILDQTALHGAVAQPMPHEADKNAADRPRISPKIA
jgi:hypothetical protein